MKCFYHVYCLNSSSTFMVFKNQFNIHFVLSFVPIKRISKLELYWFGWPTFSPTHSNFTSVWLMIAKKNSWTKNCWTTLWCQTWFLFGRYSAWQSYFASLYFPSGHSSTHWRVHKAISLFHRHQASSLHAVLKLGLFCLLTILYAGQCFLVVYVCTVSVLLSTLFSFIYLLVWYEKGLVSHSSHWYLLILFSKLKKENNYWCKS